MKGPADDRMKSCAEKIVRILEEAGFRHVFGHPGEQILPLYDALRKSDIQHVLMRHEQGAVHAADGYARASGVPGLCVATGGPGALNLVMGAAAANIDSVPLLMITGDLPESGSDHGRFQEVDTSGVFGPVTMKTTTPSGGDEALSAVMDAIETLKGRGGVIHINIPRDVLESDAGRVRRQPIKSRGFPDLKAALRLLKSAERPLILAGGGVVWAGASEELRAFAGKLGIPVVTTYSARGVIPEDHPLCLGMAGTRGTPAGNYAAGKCDVLLVLGARLSDRTLAAIGNPRIIHVNLDRDVLRGDVMLEMDVRDFLKQDIRRTPPVEWLRELEACRNARPAPYEEEFMVEGEFRTSLAVRGILEAAPDAIIVNDAGSHTTWVTLCRKVLRERSLIFSGGFGPMGYGLPAAVGASLAEPHEDVVLIAGDGGFQMTMQELGTVAELGLPVTMCILNNSRLDVIRQWQEMKYGESYGVELKNPDFVKLAGAYGIGAVGVESYDDLSDSLEMALASREPFLLDIKVGEEDIPYPTTGLHEDTGI